MNIASNSWRCLVSPPIGQALTVDAFKQDARTFGIRMPGLKPFSVDFLLRLAVVISEIKFRKIALQVLRADMVKSAEDAALEDRKVSLDSVGVGIATDVLASPMINNFMALEHGGYQAILPLGV